MSNKIYTYSVVADFPSKEVDIALLTKEIKKKDLNNVEYGNDMVRFISASNSGDRVTITYSDNLSTNDKAKLDGIIGSHKYGLDQVTDDLGSFLNDLEVKPNYRGGAGITNRDRQVMTWRLPNGSSVQMYINPQSFVVAESKQINHTRTKGGFVVQYWGDNLTRLTLSGTTGSSGVKGIQVLRNVYRAENEAFDLVAATQISELTNLLSDEFSINDPGIASTLFSELSDQMRNRSFVLRPSLASLALSILLFYQGIQYRGFFTEFTMTENTTALGLFDYNMTFMVTEVRGSRDNFMAWHKEPLADSAEANAMGGVLNAVGNSIRSLAKIPGQTQHVLPQFHPESAPLSFGGGTYGGDPLAVGDTLASLL